MYIPEIITEKPYTHKSYLYIVGVYSGSSGITVNTKIYIVYFVQSIYTHLPI